MSKADLRKQQQIWREWSQVRQTGIVGAVRGHDLAPTLQWLGFQL